MFQSLKNIYHYLVALGAVAFYRYPAKKLIVIGVTGTDGKTTTANMIYEVLLHAGKNVGLISTVGAKVGDDVIQLGLHVTTPNPFALQKLLRTMVDQGCTYAVVEATSHGLDQNRLTGCNFYGGVLTNITHEHLDYHKTFDRYVKAKAKLFRGTKVAVINNDGPWYKALSAETIAGKTITYGLTNRAETNPVTFPLQIRLPGAYNMQNALAAAAMTRELGVKEANIKQTLSSFQGVEGRLDEVSAGQSFKVFVDFAHTPYATEQVLKALRTQTKGRLIAMFGSAGERDKTKRPITGKMVAENADIAIVTADDPASEDVNDIISQIVPGCLEAGAKEVGISELSSQKLNGHVFAKIPDRYNAMKAALSIAKRGDIVALLGKGSQKSLSIGDKELPWNEKQIAADILEKLGYHG